MHLADRFAGKYELPESTVQGGAIGAVPSWILAAHRPATAGSRSTLASGGSGCNKLMGRYTLGSRGQLTVGPLASTRMACSPDLMAQENALHTAFARTTGYRIDGNALELREGDAVLARFVARAIQ